MRIRMSLGLMLLAAVCVAAPVWARAHTETPALYVEQPMTIAGSTVTLQPGHYEFRVTPNDTNVEILKDNKMVAQVKGQWVNLGTKAEMTEVVSNNNVIQEIDLKGENQAIRFSKTAS